MNITDWISCGTRFFFLFFFRIRLSRRPRGHCQCLSQTVNGEIVWSIYVCTYHNYTHDTIVILQVETLWGFAHPVERVPAGDRMAQSDDSRREQWPSKKHHTRFLHRATNLTDDVHVVVDCVAGLRSRGMRLQNKTKRTCWIDLPG